MTARLKHRLPGWQRWTLFASGLVLLLSGLVWLALHYVVGAGGDALPHPLEPWAMRLHGFAASVALFALGALAAAHIPHGWHLSGRPRWAGQRGTGVALCTLGAALAFSGYLLYYFAPESVRPGMGWVHSALGILAAAVLVSHRRTKS